MIEKVIEIVERETGEKVKAETRLDSLDVDSLEFLDLALQIERECGVPSEDMFQFQTFADFER